MRKWYKYELGFTSGNAQIPIDQNFSDHAAAMGGYDIDQSYSDENLLFKKYFFGFQYGRLERYYDFILKNIPKDSKVLSIASGRGILEYYMKKNGYHSITCSDLETSVSCDTLGLDFVEMNILESASEESYDAVICLSLIYLFDNEQLSIFFKNIQKKLKHGGLLILDSAGSPDTFFSHLINEVYLFFEMWFYRFYKYAVQRKWYHIQTKHFGYRRSDEEIISLAKENGFIFHCQENSNFLTEFRRSMIFRKMFREGSYFESMLGNTFGKKIPYVRLFRFQSVK